MQCEFYGPSQAKAEVKLAEWKKANARAISIIAQIIERPSTNSDACVIRVSTKTASNDSRPGRPEAAGRHRKKGAESERPQAYTFLVELGGFHSRFQSDSPDDAVPGTLGIVGEKRQSRRFYSSAGGFALCVPPMSSSHSPRLSAPITAATCNSARSRLVISQSSSASRFAAGAFGFLTLSQRGERPWR